MKLAHPTDRNPRKNRTNLIVLWHLFSLDAPSVAVLWAWFVARCNRIPLPPVALLALGVAVWMLYAGDRLLDARFSTELEVRHHFHRRNRGQFCIGIVASAALLSAVLPSLPSRSMHLYSILGAMLFGYFIFIHAGSVVAKGKFERVPKELAVGIFFSAATFIPTVAREPSLQPKLLPLAFLFAIICGLNCLFIYAWEHPQTVSEVHAATPTALRFLRPLAVAATILGVVLGVSMPLIAGWRAPWPIPIACSAATTALLLLDRKRKGLDPTTLRAAADLCLLTPLLLVPFPIG